MGRQQDAEQCVSSTPSTWFLLPVVFPNLALAVTDLVPAPWQWGRAGVTCGWIQTFTWDDF